MGTGFEGAPESERTAWSRTPRHARTGPVGRKASVSTQAGCTEVCLWRVVSLREPRNTGCTGGSFPGRFLVSLEAGIHTLLECHIWFPLATRHLERSGIERSRMVMSARVSPLLSCESSSGESLQCDRTSHVAQRSLPPLRTSLNGQNQSPQTQPSRRHTRAKPSGTELKTGEGSWAKWSNGSVKGRLDVNRGSAISPAGDFVADSKSRPQRKLNLVTRMSHTRSRFERPVRRFLST